MSVVYKICGTQEIIGPKKIFLKDPAQSSNENK